MQNIRKGDEGVPSPSEVWEITFAANPPAIVTITHHMSQDPIVPYCRAEGSWPGVAEGVWEMSFFVEDAIEAYIQTGTAMTPGVIVTGHKRIS